jgi:hypothetical protein
VSYELNFIKYENVFCEIGNKFNTWSRFVSCAVGIDFFINGDAMFPVRQKLSFTYGAVVFPVR